MAPCKPPKPLKVLVPKHNSDKLSAAAAAAVKDCAKLEGKKFQGHGPKSLITNSSKAASAVSAALR